MARFIKAVRVLQGAAALSVLLTVPVVATESYREYDTWNDRPLGVLDVFYGILHHDLPPMPDWPCARDGGPRIVNGQLDVRVFKIGTASSPYTEAQWETTLARLLGVPVDVHAGVSLGSVETARAMAIQQPRTLYLALQDGYFQGPSLHEKVEGMACGNLAIVNAGSQCPEGVAGHEIGHVIGLRHSQAGLMRARAAPCDDTLSAAETAYVESRGVWTELEKLPIVSQTSGKEGKAEEDLVQPDD